ncbi:MAG: CcmD family protein, partial [Spirochaetota bacterium]|nr:CcmD family protein [Spirochaetota bacterium]
ESLQSSSNFSMNEIQASTICNRGILFAQEKSTKKDSEEQAQDDSTVTRGILIKVMLITMIVWFGLSVYLFSLSKKITKLEKKIDEL